MILLIVLFFPYIKAEYLTAKYGDEFDDGYEQTGMINGIEYFRVVEYNDSKAVVCYIVENHSSLAKIWSNEMTIMCGRKSAGTVFGQKSGSADNFCWPYYR